MSYNDPDPTLPFHVLNDGCDGDKGGLLAALGVGFEVVFEEYDDSEGYGHHSGNAIFRTSDGQYIHAECGGCSCHGSGSWFRAKSEEEARQAIP